MKIQNQDGTVTTLARTARLVDDQASTSADGVTRTAAGDVIAPGHARHANRSRGDLQGR